MRKVLSVFFAVVLSFNLSMLSLAANTTLKDTPVEVNVYVSGSKGVKVAGTALNQEAIDVISRLNTERAAYGLAPLKYDQKLTDAAMIRAAEATVVWSHTRPDGSMMKTVCDTAKGENLAYGQKDSEAVINAWMVSRGHKTNMLRGRYTKIGVAALEVNGVIYWVQLFG